MIDDLSSQPRVGISSCLLGQEVRYDGSHKRDAFLADELAAMVEWIAVCPEVELGLGVPREPIQLVETGGEVRLLSVNGRQDLTRDMREYAARRLDELAPLRLSGYVFKSRSPSCGAGSAAVCDGSIRTVGLGWGLFAAALANRWPELPVAEETQLQTTAQRDEFIRRVLRYHRRM